MSTSIHYTATHSSGRVHLRKSNGRVYTHAIVTASFGGQSFCGRRDLAEKALASAYEPTAWELVEAKVITAQEFAALTKASKQKFTTTYLGKKYTTTLDAARAPYRFAVGSHSIEHVTRSYINEEQKLQWAKRVAEMRALPPEQKGTWRDMNLANMELTLERGYWENQHTERKDVTWHGSEAEALEYIARSHCTPRFRVSELLQLEAA